MSEQHEMNRTKTHDTGVEEWLCDDCGRHFVIRPVPLSRIILNQGDEKIAHTGGVMNKIESVQDGSANGKTKNTFH